MYPSHYPINQIYAYKYICMYIIIEANKLKYVEIIIVKVRGSNKIRLVFR